MRTQDFPRKMADSEIYEVEKILARRTNSKGKVEYLIQWKGFNSDWDTWEPITNLGACLDIIEEFNNKMSSAIYAAERESPYKKNAGNNKKFERKVIRDQDLTNIKKRIDMKSANNVKNHKIKKISPNSYGNKNSSSKNSVRSKTPTSSHGSKTSSKLLKKAKQSPNSVQKHKQLNCQKRKRKSTFDSDDDDGVRYKINFNVVPKQKVENICSNNKKKNLASRNKRERLSPEKIVVQEAKEKGMKLKGAAKTLRSGKTVKQEGHSAKKKLKLDAKDSDSSRESSPFIPANNLYDLDLDPEISFRSTDSLMSTGSTPGSAAKRKMSLLNSWKKAKIEVKQEPYTPLACMKPIGFRNNGSRTPTPRISTPIISSGSSFYKTPPTSPRQTRASQNNTPIGFRPVSPTDVTATNGLNFLAEFPKIPMDPMMPTSPSAARYNAIMSSLPNKLQNINNKDLKMKMKRRDSDSSEEEVVERRLSIRQSESVYKYKEIVVKKVQGYTQVWLFTNTHARNALNPLVFQELKQVLYNAKFDDSRLILLSGSGNIFSSGIDLPYLLTGDRKMAARKMADALREFINDLIAFPKPIIAAVNGPAIGIGMAILPLCDIVYASDKASFYTPYGRLGQTPEGCASMTFPQIMGLAMANEMLLMGRKLTAIEAYQVGLVSQVFWPTSMMQEVIPRVQNMATYSAKALEASKLLIRSSQRAKFEFTNESECNALADRWCTVECQKAIRTYLDDEQDLLF